MIIKFLFLIVITDSIGVSIYIFTKKDEANKQIKLNNVKIECNELQYYDEKTKKCKNMNYKQIKERCKKDNLVYKDGACLKKQTKESCNNIQSGNDPKFKKELKNHLCEDISIEKKKTICAKFNHVYDEKKDKCICGPGTSYVFGQCVGQLTEEICFNKIAFTKPNIRTDLTSCIPMTESEKKKYCKDKGLKYSFKFQSCIKEVTPEYCKSLSVPDELFKKVPDEFNDKKKCRNLFPHEKEKICRENNLTRFWDGINCLKKLSKPTIELIGKPDISSVSLKITYNDFINEKLKPIAIDYLIYDISKDMPILYDNERQFTVIQNKDKVIKIKILKLKHNNKYRIKFKLLTTTPDFESPFSDFLEFTTKCNPSIFTKSFCRDDFGPKDNTIVTNKDPKVKKWPYFKVPNKDTNCGCTEMSIDQAKKYCKETFYPTLDGDVKIMDNNCIPAPTTTGPCLNISIKNLKINQDNNGDDIKLSSNYLVNQPFRILINWRRPNLDKFNTENLNDVYPNKYLIYRKKIECDYADEDSCTADNNCTFSPSSCSVKGIKASNTCERFTNINSKKNDYTLIHTIDVSDQEKTKFKYTDSYDLSSNTKYSYRIDPVNSIGVGKSIEISIISANTRKTEEECRKEYSDGFKKTYDVLKNCCVNTSASYRTEVCREEDPINAGYENTYNDETKKCESLINFVVPGKPSLESTAKTKNEITLKITPPSILGTPSLDKYQLSWFVTDGESFVERGRLSHNASYFKNKKNYAQNTAYSSLNWILPDTESLNNALYITHSNLKPATTYNYMIISYSFNTLWLEDKDENRKFMKDDQGNRIGRSIQASTLSITTDYSFPFEAPDLTKVGEATNNKIQLKIHKFPDKKEGGSDTYPAFITHYKIVKHIIPHNTVVSSYFESEEPPGTEIIIDLNALNQFNNDWADQSKDNDNLDSSNILNINDQSSESPTTSESIKVTEQNTNLIYSTQKYKIQKNILSNNYYFTDNNIEPSTTYTYKIYAKNNKIDQYSNDFKKIDLTTPVLNPILNCGEVTNVIVDQSFSTTEVNKVNLRISWGSVTDPNVSNYSIWPNMYNKKSNYPEYKIYLNDSLKKTTTNNSVIINGLSVNLENIKLRIKTTIEGILTRNNGSTDTIISNSNLVKIFDTLKIIKDTECNKSIIYQSDDIISDTRVPFYFDKTFKICKTRKGNIKKMNDYCQSLDPKKVYFHKKGKCIIPENGKWNRVGSISTPCTANGLDGKTIICGGGLQLKNKYTYKKPDISNALINAKIPEFNGIDVAPPAGTTLDSTKTIAYEFQDCNTNSNDATNCSKLCDQAFGSLTDNAINQPLTAEEFINPNYCATDTKQTSMIINPTETCPSCGHSDTTVTKYTGCLDGYSGDDNDIKCENRISSLIEDNDTLNKGLIKDTSNKFEKNTWYKCQYTFNPSTNEYVKLPQYPEICNPPVVISQSKRKNSQGNYINIIREKYFKKTEESCAGKIDLCSWDQTNDRFPDATNYCGTQTLYTDKKCLRGEDVVDGRNCPPYPETENYALENKNIEENCKTMCEKNNNAYFNGPTSDIHLTETEYNNKCEPRSETIKAKLEESIEQECGVCSTESDKQIINYSCTDGAYGTDAETKCLIKYRGYGLKQSGTKQIETETGKERPVYLNVYTARKETDCEDKDCRPIYSAWSTCSKTCGGGTQTRTFDCKDKRGNPVANSNCTGTETQRDCNTLNCEAQLQPFGSCSQICGGGTQTRSWNCKDPNTDKIVANGNCITPSNLTQSCNNLDCQVKFDGWGTCDKVCGRGEQTRSWKCTNPNDSNSEVATSNCTNPNTYSLTRYCNDTPCKKLCESSNLVNGKPTKYLKDSRFPASTSVSATTLDPVEFDYTKTYTKREILNNIKINSDIIVTNLQTAKCINEVSDDLQLDKDEFKEQCIEKQEFRNLCKAKSN